eukprot:m.435306 g.435306  ORF g.435306 m.435306 type:complete len:90 (-) comp17832_c0_seq1:101-370(-)
MPWGIEAHEGLADLQSKHILLAAWCRSRLKTSVVCSFVGSADMVIPALSADIQVNEMVVPRWCKMAKLGSMKQRVWRVGGDSRLVLEEK